MVTPGQGFVRERVGGEQRRPVGYVHGLGETGAPVEHQLGVDTGPDLAREMHRAAERVPGLRIGRQGQGQEPRFGELRDRRFGVSRSVLWIT